MLQKTRGIVIRTFKYKDSSLIAKIYTREYGMLSFALPGIKSRKKNSQIALFQAMNVLDLVIYYKEDKQLHYIRESKALSVAISNDISKTSIMLFLNELLYYSIPDEPSVVLFDFFESQTFTLLEENTINGSFHLYFMIEYLTFLGIKPLHNYSQTKTYFNIQNGNFENVRSSKSLEKEPSFLFHKLLLNEKDNLFSAQERELILEILIRYYQEHISGFPELKSHKVLKTILH